MERELIDMFMTTLQGPFYDHMIESTSAGFVDLLMAGERIDVGLKLGKIQIRGSSGSSGAVRNHSTLTLRKRKAKQVRFTLRGRREDRQHQQINDVSIPVNAPQQRPNTVPQQQRQQDAPRQYNNQQ